MNATLAARCLRPTHVDGGVVGEETAPTNQKTLINNQHILLIMNEYQPVASLIAIQSWYGKKSVFTKGEGNIQRNLLTLKAALSVLLVCCFVFFFSYLSFITVSNNFQKNTLNRKKCIVQRNFIKGTTSLYKSFDLTFRFLRSGTWPATRFKISMTDPALAFTMINQQSGAVTPKSEGINIPLS